MDVSEMPPPQSVRFKDLKPGDVYRRPRPDGQYFMKLRYPVDAITGPGGVQFCAVAVDLQDGYCCKEPNTCVIPIEGSFLVEKEGK